MWLKDNWFKIAILLIALVWVFFSAVLPRYASRRCAQQVGSHLAGTTIAGLSGENKIKGYNFGYNLCMDGWGY